MRRSQPLSPSLPPASLTASFADDWFSWEIDVDYAPRPPQLFFMYYLHDTTVENGCLRCISRSHYTHNPLHEVLEIVEHANARPDAPRTRRAQCSVENSIPIQIAESGERERLG